MRRPTHRPAHPLASGHPLRVPSLLDDPPRITSGPGSPAQPLARFALVGDVHAEDERLASFLSLARSQQVDAILCVGDVADGFGDLARTVEVLARERVHVVTGNHDRWFLANEMRTLFPVQLRDEHAAAVEAARFWPPILEVDTILGPLLVGHGVADDDMAVIKPHTSLDEIRWIGAWRRLVTADRFRFLAGGHTHEAMVRTIDAITILNPGTLKRDKSPASAIVDLRERAMHVYDLADPRSPVLRASYPIPDEDLCYVPRP